MTTYINLIHVQLCMLVQQRQGDPMIPRARSLSTHYAYSHEQGLLPPNLLWNPGLEFSHYDFSAGYLSTCLHIVEFERYRSKVFAEVQ